MKKILSGLIMSLMIGTGAFAYTYSAPNAGNGDFYPMMQRQLENEAETEYLNRNKTDANITGTPAGNPNFNPTYQPNYGTSSGSQYTRPSRMHFVKDENGNIKIQSL